MTSFAGERASQRLQDDAEAGRTDAGPGSGVEAAGGAAAADRLRFVAAAAGALVGADRLDVLQAVLREQLSTVVAFDAFTFGLYDATTGLLHFEAGRDGALELPRHVMHVAGTPSERVVRTRRPLLTRRSSEPHAHGATLTGTPRRSESAIRAPILTPSNVLGVLSVQSYTPDLYTAEDVELVETIATLAAAAILNIRHLEERRAAEVALRLAEQQAQRLAARMRAVADAASGLIQTRSLEALQAVVREACLQVIPLDYCTLGLYDPVTDTLRFERSYDGGRSVESPQIIPLAGTPSERVVRERRSTVALRSDDPASQGAVVVGTGRRSESVVRTPVLAGDRVLGVLSVQSYTPFLYREQDVEVLEALAAVAATAILNIEHLHQHEELEEQLRQAQKMEAVGRLAGGIAHDFNNLLTAIQGNTALVLAELGAAHPLRLELQEVQEAAVRAAGLTSQLLAFGRQQVLRPRILNLNRQIEQTQGLLRRLIPTHITMRTQLDPEAGMVRADQSQIDQVLLNLVVNARDAMPAGGEIVLETRALEVAETDPRPRPLLEPGQWVVLQVRDNGVGMDERTLGRVFEPFFSTKPLGKGTGLGLATVYGIVQQSGGAITADSIPGGGSTFTIYLPRVDGVEEYDRLSPTPEDARGGVETVLLVEDEAPVRLLARRILERSGYSVIEAQDGEGALRLLAECDVPPDLLLTDVMMPVMGGHVLAKRLRSLHPRMPIIFMSGYAGDVLDGQHAGPGTAFVQKPFTPSALTSAIRLALDHTRV